MLLDSVRAAERWLRAERPTGQSASRWRMHPNVADGALAALLMAAVTPQLLFHARADDPQLAAYVTFSLLLIAPLTVRRRWPMPVFLGVAVVAAVQWAVGVQLTADVSVLIALATVAASYPVRGTLLAVVVAEAGVVAAAARWPHGLRFTEMLTVLTVFVVAATACGAYVRSSRRVIGVLEQQRRQRERERDQQTRLAIADERNRIARDIHDVIAHGLAVIVNLAAASTGRARTHPTRVDQAVELIEQAARTALTEARHAVGTIRHDVDLRPTPTITELATLLETATTAGLRATLHTTGAVDDVPTAVGVAVYRVTQEAMTNTLRHATANTFTVDVTVSSDQLVLSIEDDGTATRLDATPRGVGIIGMRERIVQLGGTFSAGPADGGGWRVAATIPLPVHGQEVSG
jgi:signal transduction histidine kinase